jgi:hypothetical protein
VRWEFVGNGARDAPFDHNAPEYVAYWRAHLDNSQRQQQHPLPIEKVPIPKQYLNQPMLSNGVPSLFLHRDVCDNVRLGAFVYGAPFREAVLDDARLEVAFKEIDWQDSMTHNIYTWCPVPVTATRSRLYCGLVLRLQFLISQLNETKEIIADTSQRKEPEAAQQLRAITENTQLWIDAHWMLVCAINRLGYIPEDDDGPEWAILLERYSPDVNMFFHRGELPSLYSRIVRTPFFSAAATGSDDSPAAQADALLRTFRKALPVRCQSRDSATKDANEAARSRAFFCYLKQILAAILLGIYENTQEHSCWRLRLAVYELFFFILDPRLVALRVPRADGHLGGSREALRADFAIDRTMISLGNDVRIALADYTEVVRQNFLTTRREAKQNDTDAVQMERAANDAASAPAIIVASNSSADNPTPAKRARSGTSNSVAARKRREAAAAASVSATTYTSNIDTFGGGNNLTQREREVRSGFALANAIGRLQVEQELGLHHWQQCKAAGVLPTPQPGTSIENGVLPPLPPDTAVTDVYALRNILPCDERMPESLESDAIIFEFINARSESVSRAAAAAAAANGVRKTGGGSKQTPHYIHQTVIIVAVRAFMCNALRRYPELRREICARTQWAEWESHIGRLLDYMRTSLSLQYTHTDARPGIFLSHFQSYNCMNSSRSQPTGNLYRTPLLPFTEVVELEITKFLTTQGGLDRATDNVMPAEYSILLGECLRRLNYPRAYRDPIINNGATTASGDDTSSATNTSPAAMPPAPYYEYIDRDARPVFTILPTKNAPEESATLVDIRRDYVERALVPLRAFRATGATIDNFNRVHMAFVARNSPKVVGEYVRRLAKESMFQLQIIYMFAKECNNYCRVYTFPLPLYLERPINTLLCREHRIDDPADLPPHASRTAVCTHCHRAAVFVETARKRNMSSAIGTDRTKLVSTTVNERVITNVTLRGAVLAPDQCNRAASLYKALARRAFRARSVVDDVFNDDPVQRRLPPISPQPSEEEENAATAALLADCFEQSAAAPLAVDVRTQSSRVEYAHAIGEPRPPMFSVGGDSDNPLLAMLDYERAMWLEYSRRTPTHKLLLGHNIASEQREEHYDVVRYTDNPANFKSEVKKQSRAKEVEAQKELITDPAKRAARERSLQKSRRANVLTFLLYKQCSESAMFEFDRRHALVSSKVRTKPLAYTDFYLCCCVCGVSGLRSDAVWRGAMLVCKNCVTVQPSSSTLAADQSLMPPTGVNESKSNVGGGDQRKTTMSALLEQYASASSSVLFDNAVPDGAQCIIKGCLTVKSPLKSVYGKEVFDDTRVGAERFRVVFICAKHAQDRSWIFAPSTQSIIPLSMLLTLCFENRGRISERDQEMDHLPRYMEQLSASLKLGRGIVDAESARRRAEREAKRREEVAAALAAAGEIVPEIN